MKATTEKGGLDIINALPTLLVVANKKDIIEKVSPFLLKTLDYKEEELTGKPLGILFSRQDNDNFFKNKEFTKLLEKSGTVLNHPLTMITSKGATLPVKFSAGRTGAGPTKTVCTAVDVSPYLQKEAQLYRQKEEAISANNTKFQFLANMSRDINAPLNAVIGFSDLLNTICNENKQKKYISSIQSAGKSLTELVNNILDFSKIEVGKLRLRYEAVNLDEIFNDLKEI
ncbi:MAG: PAS domain-containing protein, partial [bacterium]|nr:PAS domain-containing protein [bacterium]